jgi:protein-disulfide isomerase
VPAPAPCARFPFGPNPFPDTCDLVNVKLPAAPVVPPCTTIPDAEFAVTNESLTDTGPPSATIAPFVATDPAPP